MRVRILKRIFMKAIDLAGQVFERCLTLLNVSHESEIWSPYVIYIGRKLKNSTDSKSL